MKTITHLSDLKPHQIRFVVKRLAEKLDPQMIIDLVKEIYDLDLNVDLMIKMNPLIPDLCVLDEGSQRLFFDVRGELIEQLYTLPVCSIADRLEKLNKLADKFENEGNVMGLIRVLEDARLETGPVYKELVELLKMSDAGVKPPESYDA